MRRKGRTGIRARGGVRRLNGKTLTGGGRTNTWDPQNRPAP
jgi:hypothetical protein